MLKIGNIFYTSRNDSEINQSLSLEDKRKVFISYDYRNKKLSCIRDIVAKKTIHLFDVSVCFHGKEIKDQENIKDITDAIIQCDVIILLLTDNISSYNALWDYEVKMAFKFKKRIIPINFNIFPSEYQKVSNLLNDKIPILNWPVLENKNGIGFINSANSGNMSFDDAFERALRYFIADKKLAQDAEMVVLEKKNSDDDFTIEQKFYMGYAYLHGIGVLADEVKGIKLLDEVARFYYSNKNPDDEVTKITTVAAMELIRYLEALRLYNYDFIEHRSYSEYVSIAEHSNDSVVICDLGLMLFYGEGTRQNYTKAKELFEKSARMGYSRAFFDLAIMYLNGITIKQDAEYATELFQKAADMNDAAAICNLAVMYCNGEGKPKDIKKAAMLYQKSADLGDTVAIYNLGILYKNGYGVPKNLSKAFTLFLQAADMGYARAIYSLANMYESGDGTDKNLEKAAELYKESAIMGNTYAVFHLGMMYLNGIGVAKNSTKAVELFQQAASKGYTLAYTLLGLAYENGDGLEKNIIKAKENYDKAVNNGDALAKMLLSRM